MHAASVAAETVRQNPLPSHFDHVRQRDLLPMT